VDERFFIHKAGCRYGRDPARIVLDEVASVPDYIQRGWFRPIGRMNTVFEHSIVYQTSIATNIPVNVLQGLARILAAAILGYITLRLAQQYLGPKSSSRWVFGSFFVVVFAVHLMAAGGAGAPLIFPRAFMVNLTAGLGLALLLGLLFHPGARITPQLIAILILAGFLVSAANETATLGIGIALSHVILLSWRNKSGLWNPGIRGWLIVVAVLLTDHHSHATDDRSRMPRR
jgi:hypothetical protein